MRIAECFPNFIEGRHKDVIDKILVPLNEQKRGYISAYSAYIEDIDNPVKKIIKITDSKLSRS